MAWRDYCGCRAYDCRNRVYIILGVYFNSRDNVQNNYLPEEQHLFYFINRLRQMLISSYQELIKAPYAARTMCVDKNLSN